MRGWMRPSAVSVALLLLVAQARADTNASPPPDLELLEFLGQWQTPQGQWMDPTQFADPAATHPKEKAGKSPDESSRGKRDE